MPVVLLEEYVAPHQAQAYWRGGTMGGAGIIPGGAGIIPGGAGTMAGVTAAGVTAAGATAAGQVNSLTPIFYLGSNTSSSVY
jgi:hypothetical protein